MVKKAVVLLFGAILLGGIACGDPHGDDDDDSSTPTPTGSSSPTPTPTTSPTADYDYTINGVNFAPHEGENVGVRVLDDQGNEIACANDMVVSGGNWNTSFSAVLVDGMDYTIEIFASTDGNDTYDVADHRWVIVHTAVIANVNDMDYDHGNDQTPPGQFDWTEGTGCQ